MKQLQREIGMGDVLHFPKDIAYLHYEDRIVAVAVETANWIVLPSVSSKGYLEERYRLRLCEADMKQLVGLPQQSNYYGERCWFLHGYQNAGDHSCLENLA